MDAITKILTPPNDFWWNTLALAFTITITPLIFVFLVKRSKWFAKKNKEWVFVGNDIYKIVIFLLLVPILASVIFFIRETNLFSLATVLLLLFAAWFIRLRRAILVGIPIILSFITVWMAEAGGKLQSEVLLHWDSGSVLILGGIIIVFLIVIKQENNVLKKPWDEVEKFLIKYHRTNEKDRFREAWEQIRNESR